MTDNELYQLYRDTRDDEAFKGLVDRFLPNVRKWAEAEVGDEADDITQEVFLQLARAAPRFKTGHQVGRWIGWLTKCRIRNAHRRKRVGTLMSQPCARTAGGGLLAAFSAFTDTLSDDDREMLTLHLEGVQKKEIGRRFGLHRNTVRYTLDRLKEQAANALAEYSP